MQEATKELKVDWGNAPQWVSAVCAVALAMLAVYGFFFSKTSQAFVSYLQSELALRNIRIASMEERERELQRSIGSAQASLDGLATQKGELEKQVDALNAEREKKVQELNSALASSELALTREKLVVEMTRVLGAFAVFRLNLDVYKPAGVRAQTLRPWTMYLSNIDWAITKLSPSDQPIARLVKEKFLQQCDKYSSKTIQIPAMRVPQNADLSRYPDDREKHPVAMRAEAVSRELEKAENEIAACFRAVK